MALFLGGYYVWKSVLDTILGTPTESLRNVRIAACLVWMLSLAITSATHLSRHETFREKLWMAWVFWGTTLAVPIGGAGDFALYVPGKMNRYAGAGAVSGNCPDFRGAKWTTLLGNSTLPVLFDPFIGLPFHTVGLTFDVYQDGVVEDHVLREFFPWRRARSK